MAGDAPAHRDSTMDYEEPTDGSFSTRVFASRLCLVARKHLNDEKEGSHKQVSFGSMMNIASFSVPEPQEWMMRLKNLLMGPSQHVFQLLACVRLLRIFPPFPYQMSC